MENLAAAAALQYAHERLRLLGLSDEDLQVLRRQGFVAAEYRISAGQRWGPYFKLRWRQAGRQRVLYLGVDSQVAANVRAALAVWQRPFRLAAEAKAILRSARGELQSLKDTLAREITLVGKRWHGYDARRPRDLLPAATESPTFPSRVSTTLLFPTLTQETSDASGQTRTLCGVPTGL